MSAGEGTNITREDISITSHEILYMFEEGSTPTAESFTQTTNLDTTIVQMFKSDWASDKRSESTSLYFNGWNASVNDTFLYYTSETTGGKTTYGSTTNASDSGVVKDGDTPRQCAIMPGDGIVFGGEASYDPVNGVLTVPENAELTFTATWEISKSGFEYDPVNPGYLFRAIFTVDLQANNYLSTLNSSFIKDKPATIYGKSAEQSILKLDADYELESDLYISHITIENTGNYKIYANGHRLIIGEDVTTSYTGKIADYEWYDKVNADPGDTHEGFKIYGGSQNTYDIPYSNTSHIIIQSGQYSSVFGGGNEYSLDATYVSIGTIDSTTRPNIFAVYGGHEGGSTSGKTNVQVNSGNVLELMGGGRAGNTTDSTNVEINGGYVSYLNGAQRNGSSHTGSSTGDNSNTAVNVSVTAGKIDYLFGSVKDGNTSASNKPVNGNIQIKVTGGDIYALFGGGYDFWETPQYPSVFGNIHITITGGRFGSENNVMLSLNNNYAKNITPPLNYYDKEAGIYGGGYRGSVMGNVTILIGSSDPSNPVKIGENSDNSSYEGVNVYGGGSGGRDDSVNTGNSRFDTTGKSYIGDSSNPKEVKVVIGNAEIYGNVYGGGKGVSKSSSYKYDSGGPGSGVWTDTSGHDDVATVFGTTTVQIQDSAILHKNVFGAGKGVSKTAWIGYDSTQNLSTSIISSRLYNIVGGDYGDLLNRSIATYQWQYCDQSGTQFRDISGQTNDHFDLSSSYYYDGYLRLKLTINTSNEVIYSNSFAIQDTYVRNAPMKTWEKWNVELIQIAAVTVSSTINIQSGTVDGNVYGGGSYGVVGNVIPIDDTSIELHRHELKNGQTNVNIQSGLIKGNVFGGGMGEPDNVSTGSVGLSSSIVIGNDKYCPTISKNIYGGGENGFIGGTRIAIHYNDTIKDSSMNRVSIGGKVTNTYRFNIDVTYSDEESLETPGTSKIVIHDLNESILNPATNVFGGGYGVNATVTGSTDVKIAGGHVNYVYGGGELGMVGRLTGHGTGSTLDLQGGSTFVSIIGTTVSSDNATKVTVSGSVYGGGKGRYTTSAEELILGSVGSNTSVTIQSETLRGVVIGGSVLGGGELGLVGNYTVSNGILSFTGGETTVKINGGIIYDNVFGGGLGSPYNTLSGAVGKTNVIIGGTASVDPKNKRGGITNTTTQIGYGSNDPVPHLNLQNSNDNSENNIVSNDNVILSAGEETTNIIPGPLSDFGITAEEGKRLIAIVKPGHGSISVNEVIGSDRTAVTAANMVSQGDFKYNVYSVSENSKLELKYSDSAGRYSPTWYAYHNSATPQSLGASNPLGYTASYQNDTIYIVETDLYNTSISMVKPDYGQINVLLDGQKIAPESEDDISYIFAAPVGKTLTLIYEAPTNSGYYATTWTGTTSSNGNNATLTVPDKGTPATVSVQTSNIYTITVEDPDSGKIEVYDPNNLDTPLATTPEAINTYEVIFGTALVFKYIPDSSSENIFVKRWISDPLSNMSQFYSDPDLMIMKIMADTTISVSEGPSMGNVYGGGAYGLVGNVTIDMNTSLENGRHPIIGSDNASETNVLVLGGKIGSDNPGSLSTGNVFGGSYGPNAVVAGSTHVYIGNAPSFSPILSDVTSSCIGITDSVYGGGEMGSVGATFGDTLYSYVGITPDVSSNVLIHPSEKSHTIIIGKPIKSSEISDSPSELVGNVFGGGQGGDIPEAVLKMTLPEGVEVSTNAVVRNGYAVVYGPTNVIISGVGDGESSLGNKDSNIRIGSGVYGGGEGLVKGHSKDYMVTDAQAIINSVNYGRVAGSDDSSVASRVFINDAVVTQSVFGGGKLGILGNFDADSGLYEGKDSIVYISGFVRANVFGGGEGHTNSAISGAVGNSLVIIGGNAEIGSNDGIYTVPGPDGLTISGGNVYGGGRLSVLGNFSVDVGNPGTLKATDPLNLSKDNTSETNVVILGGKIFNSVYGGGFSPKATIAGSTHIYVGDAYNNITKNPDLISNSALCGQLPKFFSTIGSTLGSSVQLETSPSILIGNIYGGGEMGSVGSTVLIKDGSEGQLDPSAKHDTNNDSNVNDKDGWVSANINIKSSTATVTIGISKDGTLISAGNVFGGGKGVLNSVINNIPGYAIIRGNTTVSIDGNASNSNILIKGNVFGGGEGVISDVASIRYAEVYDHTDVTIKNAKISGNVYGGGSYGIIGHFIDSTPKEGEKITIIQYDEDGNVVLITGTVSLNEDNTVNIKYVEGETENIIEKLTVTNREFCGDDVLPLNGEEKFKKGPKAYNGTGTACVSILDAEIYGDVFGAGRGAQTNILAGAVGRGTEVNIKVTPTGNSGTTVTDSDNIKTIIGGDADGGNVYGGGEFGIVGSITTQIIGTGAFSPVKVLHACHVSSLDDFPINGDYSKYDYNKGNDVELVVNILGGTINGNVFGSGRGEEIRLEGVNYEGLTVSYYKLSSFGRTEVNVSNGIIKSSVYGGSQNGETGSFSVLQRAQDFTNQYWQDTDKPYAPPSNVPPEVRDNGYTDKTGNTIKANLPNFSATFVNLIGGRIGGNVFGGGYFGAIYGTSHVHMGWNAMMPDSENGVDHGDCHYYNNYGTAEAPESNFGGDPANPYAILPFDKDSKNTLVSNLFINGSVYAGGDRGNPDGVVSYDFVTIYGTSHILLNGSNYAAGTDTVTDPTKQLAALYVRGSLFGSGNSCSAFYDTPENSHFITIKNYQAVTEGTNFSLFSIQRASSVTLINSRLKLLGRADGANANPTELYSLNYIYKLTLQSSNEGSSQIILDAPTKDLRMIVSQVYDGSTGYEDTTVDKPYNTIQLNGGIVLEIKKDSGNPKEDFGQVKGYFYLDVDLLSYYNAYVYGQRQIDSSPDHINGGFVYGDSFYGVSFGEIKYVDSIISGSTDYENLTIGYRAWLPVGGGGHLTTSSTVVATNDTKTADPSDPTKEVYVNTGKITLPMTGAGSIYNLIGYNIYPSQIAKLGDENRSLILVSGDPTATNGFDGAKLNEKFKLKISVGNGFAVEEGKPIPSFWFVDDGASENIPTLNTSGGVLPQFNLELYSQGVTRTAVAGSVVLIIQEMKPVIDSEGNVTYEPGNEINITITIETQSNTFGNTVTDETDDRYNADHVNYEDSTTLYVNSEGKYSWQYIVPPISNTPYQLTLKNIKLIYDSENQFTLVDSIDKIDNDKNKYVISIKANDVKNREGWSLNDIPDERFLTEDDFRDGKTIQIGTTDGRYQAGILITLYSSKPNSNVPEGYPKGTVTFEIDYTQMPKVSTYADSAQKVSSQQKTPSQTGKIYVDNDISTQLEIYTVSFVPGTGVASIPSKQVNSGETLYEGNKTFVDDLISDPPKKEGVTFKAWKELIDYDVDSNGKYVPILSKLETDLKTQKITKNTTLYAVYKYAVIFHFGYNNDKGSEVLATLDVGDDGKITDSDLTSLTTTRPGYEFAGWYTSSTDFSDINKFENNNIKKSIDVYAKWNPIEYTIHFDVNYSGSESITAPPDISDCTLVDPEIQLPPLQSPVDKTFGGWSSTGNVEAGVFSINLNDYIESAVETDGKHVITLYAIWTDKPVVQVKLDKTDTSAEFFYSVYIDTPPDLPSISDTEWKSITGGSFLVDKNSKILIKCKLASDGKYDIKNATSGAIDSTGATVEVTTGTTNIFDLGSVSGSTSVVINLKGQEHIVGLDALTGGTVNPSGTENLKVIYGEKFTNLFTEDGEYAITAVREGYEFKGWYLQNDATKRLITSEDMVYITDNTQKLVASYAPTSYDVFLTIGSNVSVYINENTYPENSPNLHLGKIASQNTEFTFSVFIPKGYTQTDVSKILQITTGDTPENVKPLSSSDYSIGAGVYNENYTSYTVIIKQNVIKAPLYITLSDASINKYDISGTVSDNGTPATSKLQGITISYTTILDGHTETKTVKTGADGKYTIASIIHGTTVSILINQWGYKISSMDLGTIYAETPSQDLTLNKNLNVKYDLNNGSGTTPTDSTLYGPKDTIALKGGSELTRTGYTFAGWAVSQNGTALSPDTYSITTNASGIDPNFTENTITFYAVWTAGEYTVTYDNNDGTGEHSDPATYDSDYTLYGGDGFSKTDYELVGWNTKSDGTGTLYELNSTITWTTASDATLYAVWKVKTYTVTVTDKLNDDEVIVTTDYNAYIIDCTKLTANSTEADAMQLKQKDWGYALDNVPAGTYNIFFNLKDYDYDPTTKLSALAKLNETLEVGEGKNTAVVQIWSINFRFGNVCTTNDQKGSYNNMKEDRLLVVDGALPYQYNPFLIDASGSQISDDSWKLPTSNEYYFAGWYTDADCTTPWKSSQSVTNQVTVYAKWIKKELTITFKNGNSLTYDGSDHLSGLESSIKVEKTYYVDGKEPYTVEEASLDGYVTSWSNASGSPNEVKNAGTYTLTLTGTSPTQVPTITSTDAGILYVSISDSTDKTIVDSYSGTKEYIINRLPITIIPNNNQWKFYGNDLDHIYTSVGDAVTLNTNRIEYKITTTINGSPINDFTPGDGIYSSYDKLDGALGLLDRSNPVGDIVTKDFGTYTISLGGLVTDETNKQNLNYIIGLNDTPVDFKIEKLPISIHPNDGQWKYYGDSLNKIHTGADDNIFDFSSIGYTISAIINGMNTSDFTPHSGAYLDYAELNNLALAAASLNPEGTAIKLDQYAGAFAGYTFILEDEEQTKSSNTNYDIILDVANKSFEVKPLPITITPDAGQKKYYGDADQGITYTISLSVDGVPVTDNIAPDQWKSDWVSKGYADLESIEISYGTSGHDNYLDAGSYGITLNQSGNSNYEISSYIDPITNKPIQFTIDKLPIFIVPEAGQWKYYGYDLTNSGDVSSNSCIFIPNAAGNNDKFDALQYRVYDFRSNDRNNVTLIDKNRFTADGTGYKELNGRLDSEMLKSDAHVGSSPIYCAITNEQNTDYIINYFGDGELIPAVLNNNAVLSDNGSNIAPQPGYIVERDVTIVWNDFTLTYDGQDHISDLTPSLEYTDINEFLSDKLTIQLTHTNLGSTSSVPIDSFLLAGYYTVTVNNTNEFSDYNFTDAKITNDYTISKASLTINIHGSKEYTGSNTFVYDGLNISSTTTGNITASGLTAGDYISEITIKTQKDGIECADANEYLAPSLMIGGMNVQNSNGPADRSNCYDVKLSENSRFEINADDKASVSFTTENLTYTGLEQDAAINDLKINNAAFTGTAGTDYSVTYTKVTGTLGGNGKPLTAGTYKVTVTILTGNYKGSSHDEDLTVNAEMKHVVKFDSNGGSAVEPVTVINGGLLEKPADPTKSGYTFKGWYRDAALTEPWDFANDTVTKDTILYAKWEPKDTPTPTRYEVKYDANGGEGEVPESELYFAGETVTVKSADLSRFGYTFKGWCDSVTQTIYQAEDTFRMPSRDVCLTAVWESRPIQGKEVTVTFIVDNEVYGISTTHIDTILNGAMRPDPVKEGYDFLGWYTKDGHLFTSQTIVHDNMTVYAKFKLNEDYVLVTYIIDKEIYMTLACRKSMITEPNISAGIGKELNGWYTDEELQNKFDFNTVVKEDSLTLYAEWENNSDFILIAAMLIIFFLILLIILLTKRISFYESLESEKKYDSAVIFWKGMLKEKLPLPPSSDKEFLGWYSEEGELITEETEIKHSMKLYARWKD